MVAETSALKSISLARRRFRCQTIKLLDNNKQPFMIVRIVNAADSEHDANMLYAVGMFVPDPLFIFA
jgi:hypothetical protein